MAHWGPNERFCCKDNGAFYYYLVEPGKNYFKTLLDVHEYAQTAGIPYRHILLDSWCAK